MADEKHDDKAESPWQMVWFVFGGLAVLIALWYMSGGPERSDLRGIFLAPPPPLGGGDAYGPQIGSSTYNQYGQ